MPGPKSSTPRPPAPSRPARRFTLVQANRTLPLVARIVADVVRTHDRALALQAQLERAERGKGPRNASAAGTQASSPAQAEVDRALDRLQDYVAELAGVGCELKDYRTGLIDFVGRHQGRDVLLCWKPGEDRIGFWHEVDAGFTGRRPVSSLDERA